MRPLPRPLCLASLLLLLSGCGHEAAAPRPAVLVPVARKAAPPLPALLPGQRVNYDNIDRYKQDVAEQIVNHNPDHTFFGALPPMLPAIVVMRMTVNAEGRLTEVFVQRSRDKEASAVALACIKRAGLLPRPMNLLRGPAHGLSFSETFLFNDAYKFQLRTLAPVQ